MRINMFKIGGLISVFFFTEYVKFQAGLLEILLGRVIKKYFYHTFFACQFLFWKKSIYKKSNEEKKRKGFQLIKIH